jgi:PAS domain S-box-containing protein
MSTHPRSETKPDEIGELAAIVKYSNDAIIGKTLDGIITTWNPAAERLFGYSADQIIGLSIDLVVPGDRAGETNDLLAKIRAGQQVGDLETVRKRKDGTLFPASLTVSPIYDADGTIVGASTIVRDATARVEAYEAARTMLEASQDSLVAISPQGRITDANQATVKITGIDRDQLIGMLFSDCFTDPQKAHEIYEKVFAQGMAGEYPLTIRHRDGSVREVLYNATVHRSTGGKTLAVFAASRDVTKLNQALVATRSMIESSLDSLVAISPQGRITDLNEATVKVTGVPRVQLIGSAFSDYFTDPAKANEIYQQVFAQGMAVDYPLTMRHPDGRLTEVLYNASVYHDAGGNVLGVFAAARDVTAQVQARKLIAEQQTIALERLAELEQFNRVAVGRELKMIELKKEIENLKARLTAQGADPNDQY